jgi:hypothetical protein
MYINCSFLFCLCFLLNDLARYKETLTTLRGTLQVPKELDFRTRLESYRREGVSLVFVCFRCRDET